ncbi:HD-GYP domain-containing protein [Fervidobacterium islandicum]|uniref:HD-GYP domain-containing protein n=1 Tax=Fervidobacterium islandicum TaxID=2423 RepID=A0AAJ5LCQ0_FERIS|nr:HD-GYP domain-containing protein [Fervidobacterium islandicum]UOE96747.1 HD-GYP domain-containing protein [Fervidobacterium islandicum]
MEISNIITLALGVSVVANGFLVSKLMKKSKENKYFSSQLQKFKDLSSKLRDIVVQREETFYKNLHEVAVGFLERVNKSYFIVLDGEYGSTVSIFGDSSINVAKRVKKTELPFATERVYTIEKDKLSALFPNLVKDGSEKKMLLVSDIFIGGELKAKLLFERDEPFAKEEMETIKSLGPFFTSFIATHSYVSNQGKFQKDMILTIIRILEYHDPYTKGHSKNVATLASLIAEKMGLSDEMIRKTYWAALVHDIGKIVIPSTILNKEGKLTIEEFEIIKKHPVYGHDFLSTSSDLRELAKYVYHHHERWDGKGYPSGLSGEDIPLISRIITVVDAWDAMRSDRPYRKGLPKEVAMKELVEHSGIQFDPSIVKVFLSLIEEQGIG